MNITFESGATDYDQDKFEFRTNYIDVSLIIGKYSVCKFTTKTFVNLDKIIQHVHKKI